CQTALALGNRARLGPAPRSEALRAPLAPALALYRRRTTTATSGLLRALDNAPQHGKALVQRLHRFPACHEPAEQGLRFIQTILLAELHGLVSCHGDVLQAREPASVTSRDKLGSDLLDIVDSFLDVLDTVLLP